MSSKATQWLYTKKNIAGCTLSVVAVAGIVLTGVASPLLALALVPAFYAAGALAAPSDKKERDDLQNALGMVDDDDIEQSLQAITSSIDGKVSPTVAAKVQSIVDTVHQLLPRSDVLERSSENSHLLKRTATHYLPATLAPYLAMPRLYAEHRAGADGKTAQTEVCEQLDFIQQMLDGVVQAVVDNDLNSIRSNGQFLKDRFATSSIQLDGGKSG